MSAESHLASTTHLVAVIISIPGALSVDNCYNCTRNWVNASLFFPIDSLECHWASIQTAANQAPLSIISGRSLGLQGPPGINPRQQNASIVPESTYLRHFHFHSVTTDVDNATIVAVLPCPCYSDTNCLIEIKGTN